MPIFELDDNGKTWEVEAPDIQSAIKGISRLGGQPQEPEDDGFSFTEMLGNVPGSAANVVADTASAIAHPIDTAKGLYNLGWDGLMQFYKDRYGSVDAFMNTLEKDPAGVFLEGSGLLSGGGTIAARLPGVAGKLGKAAATAGRYTDPVLGLGKGAGALTKGLGKLSSIMAGGASATYKAPEVAFKMGEKSAGQGIRQKITGAAPDVEPQALKRQMRESVGHDPEEGSKLIDTAEATIIGKAQREIDADLSPMNRDLTPFNLDKVDKALGDAYTFANTRSEASRAVVRKLERVVDEWREPSFYKNKSIPGSLTAPGSARTMVPDKDIKALGLDPATASHHDFLKAWYTERRSFTGMDKLKQKLDNVYEGYNVQRLGRAGDNVAKKVAADVVGSVKQTIRDRWGAQYDNAMSKYGQKMKLIKKVRETFGRKEDMVGRRLTSMNRDTVFADFGNRAALLKEFAKEAGLSEDLLPAIAAGRSMRGFQPRGLVGWSSGAGLGTGAGMLWGTPAAGLVAALHSPRLVGEAAFAAGKLKGLIMKPLRAIDKAMTKYTGITKRGVGNVAAQAGQKAAAGTNREQLRADIKALAQQKNMNLHQRVIDSLVDQLTSDDPRIYMRGVEKVSKNKRLMALMEELGKGGE